MYTNSEGKVVQEGEVYIALDGTKYPYNYPKSEITELSLVTKSEMPKDEIIMGFKIEGNVQVWETREKTKEEIQDGILLDIKKLENSITPCRLAEAIISEEGKIWLTDVMKQIWALEVELGK